MCHLTVDYFAISNQNYATIPPGIPYHLGQILVVTTEAPGKIATYIMYDSENSIFAGWHSRHP